MEYVVSIKNLVSKFSKNKLIFYIGLGVPLVVYLSPLLMTGNNIAPGDADFQFQLAEAFRKSILEYHQFPWWNPWVAGGVPLFANVQFGVFSLQSPLILLFGAVVGLKLSIVAFYLLGFYGLLKLFRDYFKTPLLRAVLLAYIWSFGTFLSYRVAGGHFTFLYIQFLPLLLALYFTRDKSKLRWLQFSSLVSLMILSSPHYMTIFSLMIVGLLILVDITSFDYRKNLFSLSIVIKKTDLSFFIKSAVTITLLAGYRMFYTLLYLKDYPRIQTGSREAYLGVFNGFRAIAYPFNQVVDAPFVKWTWLEVSAYIGFFTVVATSLVLLGSYLAKRSKETKKLSDSFNYKFLVVLSLAIIFFALAMGEPFKFSPYYIFRRLPMMGSFRVAPRMLALVSLMILFLLAMYKNRRYKKIINILLLISVVELFLLTQPLTSQQYIHTTEQTRENTADFQQQISWYTSEPTAIYDRNLYEATINNYGQIVADDPLVNTTVVESDRCDVDDGCNILLSSNAKLTKWSPNEIEIERTSGGAIILNMNPGSGWRINGEYPFAHMKVVEPQEQFSISNSKKIIKIKYAPILSVDWLKTRLFREH